MKQTGRHIRRSRSRKGYQSCLKKAVSWFLLVAIIVPLYSTYVTVSAENGLCPHHPEHTKECGYAPPSEGNPCTHEHDESCGYTEADPDTDVSASGDGCMHEHDGNCGYTETVTEGTGCTHEHDETCGYNKSDPDSSCTHEHDGNCGYEEVTIEGTDCTHEHDGNCGYKEPAADEKHGCMHEHDETCGYEEPSEGSPCRFVCRICENEIADKKNIDIIITDISKTIVSWTWETDCLIQDEASGIWGLGMPGASEEMPVTSTLLTEEYLPGEITAVMGDDSRQTLPLIWTFGELPADGAYEGNYTLSASVAEDYVLSENAPALEVLLELGGGEMYADNAKYLNQWSFIARDGSKVEPNELTAAIEDLSSRSRDEIIQWLEDTVLPVRIRGWSTVNDPKKVFDKVGFVFDEDQSERKFETTKDGLKEYTGDGYKWGQANIKWNRDSFPSQFHDKDRFTVWAVIPAVSEGSDTYNIYVNSNDPEDHKAGTNDTSKKPDILSLTITIRDIDLSTHTVKPASPDNVTVNLFDYWAADYGQNPSAAQGGDILPKSDTHYHEDGGEGALSTTPTGYSTKDDWNLGINQKHLLLFGDGMIHAGLWNKGAGENCRYGKQYAGMEEIVKPVLNAEGYPELNLAAADQILLGDDSRDYTKIKDYLLTGDHIEEWHTKKDGYTYNSADIQNLSATVIGTWGGDTASGTESLQYLFDPAFNHNNKISYTDVKGLFQLDENGYYYYNMRKNFAEFSENGGNHFILYDAPATTRTDGDKSVGNFFPFNKGSEVFNGMDDNDGLTSSVACSGNAMNHHLGMTVDAEFRQPAGGRIGSGGGSQPMSFQFAGDDDVWIFLDDVLVLDLGGIHSELYGTIDFSTGDVYIGRAFDSKGIPEHPEDPAHMVTHTTLRDAYRAAGREGDTNWNNNTFASNTSHTLKMFYLERGNYDSSIALRFNLQPLLHQRIEKVDQNGNPLPGVEFALYPAKLADAKAPGAIQCLYTDSDVQNRETFYVQPDGEQALVTLTTQSDGSAAFLTGNGEYFNFADRGNQYYILKETKAPDGYRTQPVDIVLHYDIGTSMLSVANHWTTGSYACSISNVTGGGKLTYGTFGDGSIQPTDNQVSISDQQNGLVIASPMLEKKAGQIWMMLYGSNLSGFGSVKVNGDQESDWCSAMLQAALKQAGDSSTADWHLNWDEGNSRLFGTLGDLPGLASRYQLNNPDGDMRMMYGIISPTALQALGINEADAETRYKALRRYLQNHTEEEVIHTILNIPDGFRFLNVSQFVRSFRSLIYIPNERRELRVLKVDQDGKKVPGTEFTLFRDADCTDAAASGITDRDGMLIFSPTGNNDAPGEAQMIWANSTNTQYYLKETRAAAGHRPNDTVVPVIVGVYAIYADAGTAEDGVSVMAGVGRLTQTMRQYATGGDVDITLQDITAFMQTQSSGEFKPDGWKDNFLEGTDIVRSMNLHYERNAVIDYGFHEEDGGRLYDPFFVTETGFVRTRVQQNYDALIHPVYEGANTDANKEDLKDTDLTNLFSLLNMIVVTDRTDADTNTGRLSVSKKVADVRDPSDYIRNFRFKVELKDAGGQPLSGSFQYYFYGKDKSGYVSSGDTLLLHHDEAITILGLPKGTRFTVTEEPDNGWYAISSGSNVISGTVARDETAAAHFTNSRNKPEKPAGPDTSDNPGRSDSSDQTDTRISYIRADAPSTGDGQSFGFWMLLCCLSASGLIAVCVSYCRKRTHFNR